MPPMRTGLTAADAQDDFLRARRRQAVSRLARFLSRERGDIDVILPFDEVVAALGRTSERDLGLHAIPLDSIVGTVDRRSGFDREVRPTAFPRAATAGRVNHGSGFDRESRPTPSRVRTRWERIAAAMRRGDPLPPISVYRIGEVHFVRDGHDRVSVARALGLRDLDACVTEVITKVGADRALRLTDLPAKDYQRLFSECV